MTRVEVVGDGSGPEAAARDARYAALVAESDARGATLLLGHTRDDQAETVLLGLARGLGRAVPGRHGRPRRRPGAAAARAAARDHGRLLRGARPAALDGPAQRRPRVRPRPGAGPGAAGPRGRARTRASRPRWRVPRGCCAPTPTCSTTSPRRRPAGSSATAASTATTLAALPTALRTRVLRGWLRARGAHDLSADHVAAVDALVTGWHGQGAGPPARRPRGPDRGRPPGSLNPPAPGVTAAGG